MSWHIIVQDLPGDLERVTGPLPAGFEPTDLEIPRSAIAAAAASIGGKIEVRDTGWLRWSDEQFVIDINTGDASTPTVDGFAMHGHRAAERGLDVAEALVSALGVTAFIVESGRVIRS